ncbi:hypothetical protein BD311DRAFT_713874 [Dichomitus squalens]|uniref:Diphthine--ammonia ligase n=1 Tax=Dichomitus squalens TaxID=114155 RepID=A0A4Q9MXS7_9APHY|nr:hypothetical protein BD311DRAFT_713874 [Dichomitus squalens]
MKYVALLSGGKDSCYNLLHCARNGHELAAAASLGPEQGKEELDSYLYQTVGQDAIEFVGRALDVPLYRRVIAGAAVEQGGEYGGRDPAQSGGINGDETEDLYELLLTVKTRHPDIQGVSVGAILSNYQRVRVEHVCRRLGLTPLCYLWQRNQEELLSEMIEAGLEAILIKVAGIGLTTKHLGKTLAQMQPTLVKLNTLYGSHICGEGGEYETLALDSPLFKHRINLDEVETIVHSDNDFATVAYLRIKRVSLITKEYPIDTQLPVPPVLSEPFVGVRDIILNASRKGSPVGEAEATRQSVVHVIARVASKRIGNSVSVTNVQRQVEEHSLEISIEDEVQECFEKLKESLALHSLDLANCANINIFISSMDLFARVNAVYATYFGTSPPARACVAADLPPPIRVRLDCVAYAERNPSERQALHVQGLSYWAPANIGPYSQAIVADERVFISGQIGLIPSSLSLPSPQSLAFEAALSFQHVHRVVEALKNNSGGGWSGHMQSIIYWFARQADVPPVRAASSQYEGDARAPTLFLVVPELPKGALVEKQVLVHTGQCDITEDDGTVVRRLVVPCWSEDSVETPEGTLRWEVLEFKETPSKVVLVFGSGDGPTHLTQLPQLPPLKSSALSIRLFYRLSAGKAASALVSFFGDAVPITPVPVRHIASRGGDDWDYAMLAICTRDSASP